jgi:transcriptional regulator with XRE-family HTH domain
MRPQTNFDFYLEEQLKDADFAERFKRAGEAWDVALQLASLRKESGLSQKELAKKVGTSQQQISRLESPSYEGHSLSMLRRVAEVLGATVHVEIQPRKHQKQIAVAEGKSIYMGKERRSCPLFKPRRDGRGRG